MGPEDRDFAYLCDGARLKIPLLPATLDRILGEL
jgi:hypothetical protein